VLKSEIQGLPDLAGYFVQQDKVVAIRFHPHRKRVRAEGLIERTIPPSPYPVAGRTARKETSASPAGPAGDAAETPGIFI
jgi:hypothetical protein